MFFLYIMIESKRLSFLKIREQNMKKYTFFAVGIALLLTGTLIVLAACFSPWQGDKGTFSISFGNSLGSRTNMGWEIDGSAAVIEDTEHIITLSGGPGPDQTVSVKGQKPVQFSVTPGIWDIDIEGWYTFPSQTTSKLVSMGYAKLSIKPGPNGGIAMKMFPALNIGAVGPGGGIVFYYSGKEGFIDTYTGKLCHYLEVATSDASFSGNATFQWAPAEDLPGTKEGIGMGHKNTRLSWEVDQTNFFIEAGYSEFSDWYIPSKDELEQLIQSQNLSLITLTNSLTDYYWSSTQYSASEAWARIAGGPGPENMPKNTTTPGIKVRRIRAF